MTLRSPWRAVLALVLHIGFFVLPLALIFGLAAVAALTYRYDHSSGLRAGVAAVVVAVPIIVGLRAVLRPRTHARGVVLNDSEQIHVRRLVNELASTVGVRAPTQVRITSEPHAGVRQDTRLLGLRLRASYLELGLPLLAGLTAAELRAVLAGEFAFTGGSREALAHRCAVSVERACAQLRPGPTKWLFAGYARCYLALTARLIHRLRLRSDIVAAYEVGSRTAATTLRKLVGIELGWHDYGREYLTMAVETNRSPDVLLGFRSFLEHPGRKKELAERTKRSIADEPHASRNAPPTTKQRLEAIRYAGTESAPKEEKPAWALLRNPKRSIPDLERRLMVDGLDARVPWPELVKLAGAERAAERAGTLSMAAMQSGTTPNPTLQGMLRAIHRGRGVDLVNPALDPGLNPEDVPQAATETLVELLGATVASALVRAGRAWYELDWAGPAKLRLANGKLLDPQRLVRPAVADPRQIPGLHRVLVNLGVPLDHAEPAAGEPEPRVVGVISEVRLDGVSHELLVTDRGLLLLPSSSHRGPRVLGVSLGRASRDSHRRLAKLAATPVDQLRAARGTQWLDSRDVAAARWGQERWSWSLSMELYLDEYSTSSLEPWPEVDRDGIARCELVSTPHSEEYGDPYDGIEDLMGARMRADRRDDLYRQAG